MAQLLTNRRILVVDDNRDAADIIAQLLELQGHTIATAYDGREAVDVAARFDPEVIFLDINMPRMDGFEAAAFLRANPALARARLVALTAVGDAASKARMTEVGFDMHLLKPASLKSLMDAVG